MKKIENLTKYESMWIATDEGYGKVYVANKNLATLQAKVKEMGLKDLIISFIPPSGSSLAPYAITTV